MVDSAPKILSYFTHRIQAAKEQRLTELDLSVPWNTHDNDQLSYIPEEVFELTQLERLNLKSNGIKKISESITKLTNLTSLNLSFNGLKSIPESITKLTNLTELDLSFNNITSISESITRLANLTSLDLRDSEIKSIPESITKITSLTSLNLSRNNISDIPESIINLINLSTLNLSGNQLVNIPQIIDRIVDLKEINLSRNKLLYLCESIINLTSLINLDVSGNRIETIPESIIKLTNLTSLDLSNIGITSIPESIFHLAGLTSLELSDNNIKAIPESITRLSNLQNLQLRNNKIKTLPRYLANLSNLTSLDLSHNQIAEIPESIFRLTNLTNLNLSVNNIIDIPESTLRLTNLTSFNLSGNTITDIPASISQLTNLTNFDLSDNSITDIPEYIADLTNLTKLYLTSNNITNIPESIFRLTNLTSLYLNNNRITTIPDAIANLNKIKSLHLNENQITIIPQAIANLSNLVYLDLSENQITTIPEAIANLDNLACLDLSENQITTIPTFLANLTNLIELKLEFNRIEIPPIEIVEQGIKSIRDYFQQLAVGQDYIYEAKLIIVGEGGVGKTTLAKKIENPDYDLQKNEASTEGIDIITWEFDLPNTDKKFRVNIWDFGGQEIYHATHQFFLTKRSLYILVADTRKEDTDFYYWMSVVQLLTDNSPILIIKNEKQDRQREININALRGQFSNLKETLATNLQTNRGLLEIITSIQDCIKKLPHIGQVLPKTWVKVREALETDTRNYISLQEYFDICTANGFTKSSDKLQLSKYLHDLGVCLHFQEQEDSILYKTVILKPQWGTDAVYKVLDNKQVINKQGRFTRDDLKDIWQEEKYASMRGELLELMNKFQLCYEIPGNNNTFISPQLLSENEPNYKWNESDNLILRYAFPDFMPKGIISRFIVVMHQYIEQQEYVWKSGVILHREQTKAEVIEDYGKRNLRVRVVGHNKRNFMTIIIHELDQINNSFNKQLKFQKLIPCNCKSCKINTEKHFYYYKILQKFIQDKQDKIQCQQSYDMVNVLSLIDDVIIRQDIEKLENKQNTGITNIKQIIYGDVGVATGNVGRDLKSNETNIQGDSISHTSGERNINLQEGNYNEEIDGNYIDKSRSKNISNSTEIDLNNGSRLIVNDCSEEITNIINQLPNFEQEPDKKELKKVLSKLQQAVITADLDNVDQVDALEHIKAIVEAIPNNQNRTIKRKAINAMRTIQDIVAPLSSDAEIVTTSEQLPELINRIF